MKHFSYLSISAMVCGCAMSLHSPIAFAQVLVSQREPAQAEVKYEGFGAESVSADELKAYAPRSINPKLRSQIEAMIDIRGPDDGELTPDGKTMFITWNVTGVKQVWKLSGPNSFPVQMTGGETTTSLAGMTLDGQYLILSRDKDGDEFFGIFLQSVNGGPLEPIFQKSRVRASFNKQSPDGRYLYFSANDIEPDTFSISRYDMKDKKIEPIFHEKGMWFVADINRDGLLLLANIKSNFSTEYFIYNPTTKNKEPLLGKGETDVRYRAIWQPDGKNFFVITDKFGEFMRLYAYRNSKHFTNNQFEPITPDSKIEVDKMILNKDRTLLGVQFNDQGYMKVAYYNPKTLKEIKSPNFPKKAEQYNLKSITPDGRASVVLLETPQDPSLLYVVDWKTMKVQQWGTPSSPEVSTKDFVGATLESYPSRDGTKIPMFVWRGPNCVNKACPVIVDFHGGPESQSRPGFRTTLQLFLQAGFVYVAPNVRGSDGYGKTWLNSDNGSKRLTVIFDIPDVANYIKANWAVNGVKPKVGVMGGSYGGYSTLVAMSHFATTFDAGVAIVGMSDLRTFLKNTAGYRAANRSKEYGDLVEDAGALAQLSPVTFIDQVQGPLMILHGAQDPRVPVGEALQFHKKLVGRKVPSELVIFPDEGHGVRKRPNRVLLTGYIIDFFKRTLQ